MIPIFFVFIFLISLIVIGVSSGAISKSFLTLSRVIGINEYVVSFLLFGVATSLPEFFVAISAIITKNPLMSIGNIIGANLINITLVLGIVAYLSDGVDIKESVSVKIYWSSFILGLLPAILVLGGGVSRVDGFILLLMCLLYFIVFANDSSYFKKSIIHIPWTAQFFFNTLSSVRTLIVSFFAIFLATIFMILFVSSLAKYLAIDILYFSIIILGAITTLPELLFGIRSSILNHPSLAIGSLLGSIVINSTLIVGSLSVLSPSVVTQESHVVLFSLVFSFIGFFLLSIFSYSGLRISKNEGFLLILIYILFVISVVTT